MPAKLRDPRQALGDYLDEMLHQATVQPPVKTTAEPKARVLLPAALPQQPCESEKEVEIEIRQQSETEFQRQAEGETGADIEVETKAETENEQLAAEPELEFPMQCLMFRVGNHLLSIPLIQLSSVVNWDGVITRLPETPDWLLGLVKHRGSNLRVVDSHLLLEIEQQPDVGPDHLLVLEHGGWAITCDQLEQVVDLEHDDVQWKAGDNEQLALGTIRESLSTLLNPPGITRLLDSRNSGAAKP